MKELSRLIIISVVCIVLGEPLLASQARVRKDTEFNEIGDAYKVVCAFPGFFDSDLFDAEPFIFDSNNTSVSPNSSTELLSSAVDIGCPGSVDALFARGKGHLVGTSTVPQDFYKAFACFEKVAAYRHAAACYELGALYFHGKGVDKNLDKALELFREAVQLGHKRAYECINYIGFCFATGSGVTQDYKKAGSCFEEAVQGKVPAAYHNLGLLYLNGQGVEKNLDKALELFTTAAQLGNKPAYEGINFIGFCFATGSGVTQDYKKAVSCYEQAIQGKVPEAYNNLGLLCLNGQGVEKNMDKALEYFVQAAQLGYKNAYGNIKDIGFYFATGRGVTQDYKKAISCYEQAIKGKVPEAYYNLGLQYLNGQGVSKNLDKALELFTTAAQLGNKPAYDKIFGIGLRFATLEQPDYKKAVGCYEQAALHGKVPVAYNNLGLLYLNGQGVEKNVDKALEYFVQAAQLGCKNAYGKIEDIGFYFATGTGVTQDYKKAVSCYEQALPGKTSLAHCSLGVMYLNGRGVEKNFDKALEYFVQAAQLGDKGAYGDINHIGFCFGTGTGVTQDYKKAVGCYEQAAIQGKVPAAYYSLGIVYLKGQGAEKNLDKALEFWTQAAELGYQDACIGVYHCFAKGIRVQRDEKRAAAYLKKIAETLGEQEAKKRVDGSLRWFLSDDPKINCVGEMSVCPICTNKFAQGDAISILVCSAQALHIFCKDCLEGWRTTCLQQRRPLSCPCCRSTNAPVCQGHAF